MADAHSSLSADRRYRRQLRRRFRQQRRALTPGQRRRASRRLGPALSRALGHSPARHIGIYTAADGELGLLDALAHPRFQDHAIYLPVLDPVYRGRLRFHLWQRHHRLSPNRYGINEPAVHYRGRHLWALDVLLVPAVAFDQAGFRLGMGGGYYDRTLADLERRPRRPRLLTVGYTFQEVATGSLPVAAWDRPVDQSVTVSPW